MTVYGNSSVKRLYETALAEENDAQNFDDVVNFVLIDCFTPSI